MEIVLTSHFEKNSLEKEDSGKILGKTCGLGPTKEITVGKDCLRDIAPVELNGLNKITTSKQFERIKNGNANLLRYLQHSGYE